jgi:hypothetical protein
VKSHTRKKHALLNFVKHKGQFQPLGYERTWAKIQPEVVYSLLEDVSGRNSVYATELLRRMASDPWTIKATAHEGGVSDHAPLHITLKIKPDKTNPRAYHLNCKEKKTGGLYIYEITQGTGTS